MKVPSFRWYGIYYIGIGHKLLGLDKARSSCREKEKDSDVPEFLSLMHIAIGFGVEMSRN